MSRANCESVPIFNLKGGRAVMFFYTVSGFLMNHVLERKYKYSPLAG
jgi:hypothetical protein